jgi:hypothetical protein
MKKAHMMLILVVGMLFFCSPGSAEEHMIWLDRTDNAMTVQIPYGENELKGVLILQNSGTAVEGDVIVRPVTQEKQNINFTLFCNGQDKTTCPFKLDSSKRKISFKISEANAKGKYTGTMTFMLRKPQQKDVPVNITVIKKERPKDIEIASPTIKDGKIQLVLSSPDSKSIRFTLKNPDEGSSRNVKLSDICFISGQGAVEGVIKPESTITIDQGQSKDIRLTFTDYVPRGDYEGSLVITDMQNSHISQEIVLALSSPFMKVRDLFGRERMPIYLLVLLGTLVSFLLTVASPISVTKSNNRKNINECDNRLKKMDEFEIRLQQKLLVELARAYTININTKFYTPSAMDRLKEVTGILEKINSHLEIRDKVQSIRNRTKDMPIPYSERKEIWSLLNEAGACIYEGDLVTAEKKRSEADDKCNKFALKDNEFIDKFKKELIKRITLLKNDTNYTAYMTSNTVSQYIKSLNGEVDTTKLTQDVDIEFLRDLDLKYSKLDIYFRSNMNYEKYKGSGDFKNEDPQALSTKSAQAQQYIEDLLRNGTCGDLDDADEFSASLKHGVILKKDIKEAIKNGTYAIKYEPNDPSVNKPVNFSIVFHKNVINMSPLRGKFRYEWNFQDHTTKPVGSNVYHYFKRRGIARLLRKWIRRNLISFIPQWDGHTKWRDYLATWKKFNVEVAISNLDSTEPIKKNVEIQVREPIDKEYSSGITVTNVLSYVVTLVLSCILAVIDSLNENYTFKSMKDYLTPILLGFTLDIFKDTLMNPAKLLERIKK